MRAIVAQSATAYQLKAHTDVVIHAGFLLLIAQYAIAGGGDKDILAKSEHATLAGWSFCDIRLHLDNTHNGFTARGVHG